MWPACGGRSVGSLEADVAKGAVVSLDLSRGIWVCCLIDCGK